MNQELRDWVAKQPNGEYASVICKCKNFLFRPEGNYKTAKIIAVCDKCWRDHIDEKTGVSKNIPQTTDEGKEDNRVHGDHLTVYYAPEYTKDPERPQLSKPFIVDHDGPSEGDSTGFRFGSFNAASEHVRKWLYKQEDVGRPALKKNFEEPNKTPCDTCKQRNNRDCCCS